MTKEQIILLTAFVAELYQEGAEGDMGSEAKAQWLESCLESPEDYDYDSLMDDLTHDAHHWAEQLYNDCQYPWLAAAMEALT